MPIINKNESTGVYSKDLLDSEFQTGSKGTKGQKGQKVK